MGSQRSVSPPRRVPRLIEPAYPPDDVLWSPDQAGDDLAGRWIANLSPDPAQVVEAHRAFVRVMLAPPMPGQRWGFKEVRLGAQHARYLALLFPKAKFLFIHRDPWDQWRSYRRWRTWSVRWPVESIRSARQFGSLWRTLTDGMLDASDLDLVVVGYRRLLTEPAALDEVAAHLGVELDRRVLDGKLGGSPPVRVPRREIRAIARAVGPTAERLGYAPP